MNASPPSTTAPAETFDALVVGGGILGCSTALNLARGGLRVAVLEKDTLFRNASGVNAGTLAMQTKTPHMIPYHLRALELWRTTADWLGMDCGYQMRGSLNMAFTEAEAEILHSLVPERVAAGAPIEFIGRNRVRELEPGLADTAIVVSYCAIDGYADSTRTGWAYRRALAAAGVDVREGIAVTDVQRGDGGFEVTTTAGTWKTRRLVLAAGPWLAQAAAMLGVTLRVEYQVVQMAVTERAPRGLHNVVSSATNLLTLKQAANGSYLIGGGWAALGDPNGGDTAFVRENITGNLRLAETCLPALKGMRLVRMWIGMNALNKDRVPLIGPLPGVENAWVIGCTRSGFTGGPVLGRLLADSILDRPLEMPLHMFDPAKALLAPPPGEGSPAS